MMQMLFFLRFRSQLRRTRPELVSQIENSLSDAVEKAGGKITGEHSVLRASFDEDSPGFWLDMLILIEMVMQQTERTSASIYGYSMVFGRSLPESYESLCRFLAAGNSGGGVYLDSISTEGLLPFAVVEKSETWLAVQGTPGRVEKTGADNFCRLKEIKSFTRPAKQPHSLQETVVCALNQRTSKRNVLILGPGFSGKRNGVYRYCAALGGLPPLSLRFYGGGGGNNAFVDSWLPVQEHDAITEEINSLWERLFRERLRDEFSPLVIRHTLRFFDLIVNRHITESKAKGCVPVLVLEDVHEAGDLAADLFIDVYANLKSTGGLVVLGTCDEKADDAVLRKWERIFQRIIRLNADGFARQDIQGMHGIQGMPSDLWETAYALALFERYYPPGLFERLCEEEGKNPAMIARALSLLEVMGIIDSPQEKRICVERIVERAEAALGAKAGRIKLMVRRRLLDWVKHQKIIPCFRLLTILAELDGAQDLTNELILTALTSDLANGTGSAIEQARKNGLLEKFAEKDRAEAVLFICETTRALLSGGEAEIRDAFKKPAPECAAFPVLKAQILVNLAACYLGQRDYSAALETIKKALVLSQGKQQLCLPQSYRLFSLVSLSKQRTDEAIDYLGFAVENAEKSGNHQELGISAYYAATAQFLFGNISGAFRFVQKARKQSIAAGSGGWADRSLFLEGRLTFEIGNYREALEIFEKIRKEPSGESSDKKTRLLAAWAYRAKVYSQNSPCLKPEAGGSDADLFEVEAAFLAGNYRKAVELSGTLANPHTEDNFLFTEQPDWRSGFAQCELLYFSQGEIWDRMICTYRSLALCRLSVSGGEEARHNMQYILRNEQQLSEMDPWDSFYYYSWYRILEQTRANQVDINTAASMAFKRLQRRASRIDDIEIRRKYLSQPRWNSALSAAAKEFKLI